MGLIKNHVSVFVLFAVLFSISAHAVLAAGKEPLWRAVSDSEPQSVPPYAGTPSLFPQIPMPENAKVVDDEEEARRAEMEKRRLERERMMSLEENEKRRAYLAAQILGEIREILNDDAAFDPDVTDVKINAVSRGSKGDTVLVRNQWLGIGDEIQVPIVASDQLFSLVEELSEIDSNLSDVVYEEIESRITVSGHYDLSVNAVGDDYVEMLDAYGGKHVIYFVTSGW